MIPASQLHGLLKEEALAEGFALSAGVDLARAQGQWQEHVARYDRWLADGYAGEMGYLSRGRDRRADPGLVLPGTKSVFCVLLPYRKAPAGRLDPAEGPRYARYLHGRDYHEVIGEKLERVAAAARKRWTAGGGAPFAHKACVDSSAVLERSWAALAGLGWIGKNTLLIHPQLGSYFFIGTLLLDQELDAGPAPLADYCGNCERCLQACPTRALPAPHILDSRQCVSYLTLEKRGALPPDTPPAARWGGFIAGCDICQEVCPFNTKPSRAEPDAPPQPGAIALDTWEALTSESEDQYRARVKGSALSRVKPEMFRRNLAALRGGDAD